jgi:hypothetical protein
MLAKTRFLTTRELASMRLKKPGFSQICGLQGDMVAKTRFLATCKLASMRLKKPGFLKLRYQAEPGNLTR